MKVKRGTSIEITEQLSSQAATIIAQWIGGATVIYNQKTMAANEDYDQWRAAGQAEDQRPVANTKAAHLSKELKFLKDLPCQIRRNAGAKWFEAMQAARIGLRKRPQVRGRHKKRNCYVTSELFDVQSLDDQRCLIQIKADATKASRGQYLTGVVVPVAAADIGKSFYLSRQGRRFWLSISHDQTMAVATESAVRAMLTSMTDEELATALTGYDLGVKQQVAGSDEQIYHLKHTAKESIEVLTQRKQRYQRQYARRCRANDRAVGTKKRKRTNGERKLSAKVARQSERIAGIQLNNSHHISRDIANNTPLCAVFEDLKISNMVRRPKAHQCPETGQWLRNGARAKSGLNKAILGSNIGQIRQFATYKLAGMGKIAIKVKPHYSSQECSECGFTDKGNRSSQAIFICLQCGYTANADFNASKVIKGRGIQHIRAAAFSQEKTVRKISARRKEQAREPASSGGGEDVSLAAVSATLDDALNQGLTVSNGCLTEAPAL